MYKYKNISKKDLSLVGYGLVKKDEEIEVKEPINNVNFKPVKKEARVESVDNNINNNKLS